MSLNQDYALARFREDTDRRDPPLYTVRQLLDRPYMWLNIGGNIGWYAPEMKAGEMVGIRGMAFPQPTDQETPEDRTARNYAYKLVSPKQRRKIERLMANTRSQRTRPAVTENLNHPAPATEPKPGSL